jgi:4-amino-4-deoxy-L-arabinose transferase-like glycosyltransferase
MTQRDFLHVTARRVDTGILVASVVSLLVVALALRVYRLGAESLWLDEIGEALVAQGPLVGIFEGVKGHYGATPLDYLITAAVIRLSRAEWVLRLPAALWGTLSVYSLFRLGRRLGSPVIGGIAAVLLALSPFHIRYSQELRFYALFVFLAMLSTDALLVAWERCSSRAWGLYAAATTLALYSHPYTVLVVSFHAIWISTKWIASRRLHALRSQAQANLVGFTLACVAVSTAFCPWIWFRGHEHSVGTWQAPLLDWKLVREVLVIFSGWGDDTLWQSWAALAVLGLLAQFRQDRASALLLLAWVVFPLPFVVLTDQRFSYFFAPRQVLFVLPMYLLLVAFGIVAVANSLQWLASRLGLKTSLVSWVATMGITLGLVASLWPQVQRHYRSPRENWRAIGQYLQLNVKSTDLVLPIHVEGCMIYYSPRTAHQVRKVRSMVDLESAYASGRPMWVLVSHYVANLPAAPEIQRWVDMHSGRIIDFGMGMQLHYIVSADASVHDDSQR